MMSREEAKELLRRLNETRPKAFFKHCDDVTAGIGCTLRFLAEEERPVTAGEISDFMQVSTARVAVLLRKMAEKDLVVKSESAEDARRTMVTLSDVGRALAVRREEHVLDMICAITERIGKERVEQFIAISGDIKDAVEELLAAEEQM